MTSIIKSLNFLNSIPESNIFPNEFLSGDGNETMDIIPTFKSYVHTNENINEKLDIKSRDIIDKYYKLNTKYANMWAIKLDIRDELLFLCEETPDYYMNINDDTELRNDIKLDFRDNIRNIIGILYHMTDVKKLEDVDLEGDFNIIEKYIIDFICNNINEEYIHILETF